MPIDLITWVSLILGDCLGKRLGKFAGFRRGDIAVNCRSIIAAMLRVANATGIGLEFAR